jgi:hypothetical protein
MGDWYGVANAGAIVMSIAARLYILGQQRQTRDDAMKPREAHPQDTRRTSVVIRSDGKMVTLQTPMSVLSAIVRPTEPMAIHPFLYGLAQQAAWVALGTHLLVLGMCTLVTQIYTVVLLVSSTIAVSSTADWSADAQHKLEVPGNDGRSVTNLPFNDDWDVIKTDPTSRTRWNEEHDHIRMDRRLVAWARLGLSEQEEVTMMSWHLMPPEIDKTSWWMEYRSLRDEFAAARRQNSDTCVPPSSSDIALQVMRPSVQSPNHPNTPVVGLHF